MSSLGGVAVDTSQPYPFDLINSVQEVDDGE